LIALEQFAAGRPPTRTREARAPLARAGAAQLERALHKLRKRGRKLARHKAVPAATALHELRIRAKRLRYLLEFLGELTGRPGRRLVKRLVRLQDLLGEHQDAVVAAQFIERHLERSGGQLSPASERALQALVIEAQHRAARARAAFPAVWRELAGERSQAEFRRLLRGLAPRAKRTEPRSPRAGRRP
jgi:CHAD domain-containing protein